MGLNSLIFNIQMVKATNLRYCIYKYLGAHGHFHDVPDEKYLNKLCKYFYGKEMDFNDPQTFSEKLQWLKVNHHDPLLTKMVDKYEVKKYVADKIGESHVIPCIGFWDNAEDIDYDRLPDAFVLKVTHDSGGLRIIRDKKKCDVEEINAFLNSRLKRNFYYAGREWQYKNVKPRIIAEPYVDTLGKSSSVEYKITCLNGKVEFITVCKGIAHSRLDFRTNDFYDRDLNRLDMVTNYYANSKEENVMPQCIKDMINASEKLAQDFPTVRVDFYVDKDDYIFGEMTFYTWDGFFKFIPGDWDFKLGQKLILPEKR